MSQPNPPSNDRLVGQIVADRYQILAVLGEGGMGRVYLAEHVRMGRKSAVKVMSPNMALSADAISRFNREASNASRINHPNVAQIYDFGETDDGMLYLAMEFVEGETLRSLIQRSGPLPIPRAAELTRQIADALGAAHHLGIVHRDLKPDNILLSQRHDGLDLVKVVDFGIAKTVQGSGGESSGGQTVTTAGVSLGTPEYMSPEQLAGERLDARTDLYSLGLVLFNMLTANLPYPRVTSKETLVRRLTSKPQTLSQVVPNAEWPPAIQAALDRALAPEPGDRYASVTDFGRDVAAAVTTIDTGRAPVMPSYTPAGPTQRIDTPVPRSGPTPTMVTATKKRSLAVAGVLVLLVAVGAGGYVAMQMKNEPKAPTTAANGPAPNASPTPPAAVQAPDAGASAPANSTATKPSSPAAGQQGAPSTKADKPSAAAAKVSPAPADTAPAVSMAPPPPANPADTTAASRNREMSKLRHPMLRASGDSATSMAMPASDTARVRVLGEDIAGHLQRAKRFIQQGDILKARGEFRDMAPVVGVLRQLYAGTPGEARIEQMMRMGVNQSVFACRAAIQDSTARAKLPATFRCEGLIPQGMRGQRGGGRNPALPPWNR